MSGNDKCFEGKYGRYGDSEYGAILYRKVKEDLPEEVAFKKRLDLNEMRLF